VNWAESVKSLILDRRWIRKVAEIGVFEGFTSSAILEVRTIENCYLVDPWKPYKDISYIGTRGQDYLEDCCFRTYLKFFRDPRVTILRMESLAAAKLFDRELDFVYIDGDHSYEAVLSDIKAWLPKIKHPGLIAGHDYGVIPDVTKAVHEMLPRGVKFLPDEQFKNSSPEFWEKVIWYCEL